MYTERFADEWHRPGESTWVPNKGIPCNSPEDFEQRMALMAHTLDKLPLEDTSIVEHPLTGEYVIEAPESMVFRMSGRFETLTESNNFNRAYRPPTPSTEIYNEMKSDRPGAEDDELFDDYDIEPLDYFDGRYISIGDLTYRSEFGPDKSSRWEDEDWKVQFKDRSSDEGPPRLQVKLFADEHRFRFDRGYGVVDIPNTDGSPALYDYEVDEAILSWAIEYAFTDVAHLDIELVPQAFEAPKELLAMVKNGNKTHWLPFWAVPDEEMTAWDFAKALTFAFAGQFDKRNANPFSELYIVTSGSVDLPTLAKLAAEDSLPLGPRWLSSDTPEGKKAFIDKILREKSQKLTLVEGSGYVNLDELARLFSDPNWLRNRLKPWIDEINREKEPF